MRRFLDWCRAAIERFGSRYRAVSRHADDIDDVLKARTQPRKHQRIGFMAGEVEVPEDFDTMGGEDIREMFERDS